MIEARWIALEESDPQAFHHAYARAATAQLAGAAPIVLWGRPAAHICLGIHQSRVAELVPDTRFAVARRVLGGGTVWLDRSQICVVLIAPARAWGSPQAWYTRALAPFVECYRHFGLSVEQHDRDLWLDARKIAGSGAATLGHSAVFASSFMLRFNVDAFASAVRCPSDDFRDLLKLGLNRSMTAWEDHCSAPSEPALQGVLREALRRTLGWQVYDDVLSKQEIDASIDLPDDDETSARRLLPGGLKIKFGTYLTHRAYEQGQVSVLTEQRRLIAARIAESSGQRWQLEDCQISRAAVELALTNIGGPSLAQHWTSRVVETAYSENGDG